ncbi:MAG: prepilin peptidase [Oscillospiraceae bacterium]
MVNPVYMPPIIYPMIPKTANLELTLQILGFCACICLSWLFAFALEKHMAKRFERKTIIANIILPIITTALLVLVFGYTMETVKGFILFMLLLFASNSDIATREVDNNIPIMIGITALIGVSFLDLPLMILSAVLISIPQILIAILKPNTYGGADIKIMAACALLLGIGKGFFAIIIGLSLAVICTLIIKKARKQSIKASFPLVPYLAVGCMVAFFL